MASVNLITILGNVGNEPELRTTPGDKRVAQFSVATSRRWKDSKGEQQEKTEWHRVVCWEGLAELVEQRVKKGDRIHVTGRMEYRSYQDKDDVTRYTAEIIAHDAVFLGREEREPEPEPEPQRGRGSQRGGSTSQRGRGR